MPIQTYTLSPDAGGTFGSATELEFNTPHTETLGLAGDLVDCYRITLTNGIFQVLGGVSGSLKAKAALYNADGKKTASITISNGKITMKPQTLAAGTYYIMVESRDKGKTAGEYTLSVAGTRFPDPVQNNTPYDATALPLSEAGAGNANGWVGLGDSIDYYRIDPDRAGQVFVGVSGLTAKVKVTLYRADGKKLKSVTLSKDNGNVFKNGLLLDKEAVYLSVESGDKGKGKQNTGYTLTVDDRYFPAASDDNSRDKAAKLPLDQDGNGAGTNWVGMGDAVDYYRIDPNRAGQVFIGVSGLTAKVKVTLYRADGKKLKSVSLSKDSADIFKGGLLLDRGTFYLSVESGDKGKGKQNTDYTVTVDDRYFPAASDDNSRDKAAELALDANGSGSASNWVGMGDAIDYYRIDPAAAGRVYIGIGNLTAKVKVTLYRADGKKIKSVSLSKDNADIFKGGLLLDREAVYLSVESGDKGKGKQNSDYTLTVNDHYFPAATDDDTIETSDWIDLDENGRASVKGWVGYGDAADCYRIDPLRAGTVSITLSDVTAKLKVTLYSRGKKIKTLSVKPGGGSLEGLVLPAMPVYILVESGDKGKGKQNSGYTLDITDNYSSAPQTNNDILTAARLNWDSARKAEVTDWVGPDDQTDFFRFELDRSCAVNMNLIPDEAGIEVGRQLKITLYNEAGKKLKLDSALNTQQLDAAVYFISVEISNPKKYSTGYRLDVQQLA